MALSVGGTRGMIMKDPTQHTDLSKGTTRLSPKRLYVTYSMSMFYHSEFGIIGLRMLTYDILVSFLSIILEVEKDELQYER